MAEARLRDELKNLEAVLAKLTDLGLYPEVMSDRVGGFPLSDENAARIVGSYLQDFYNCFENMARVVARSIDGAGLPRGSDWHAELLRQMSMPVRGIRPGLISDGTSRILDEYRRFRHLFRNIYGFVLDAGRTVELLRQLPGAVAQLRRDVTHFMDAMSRALDIPCPDHPEP
ncbi:MAG TPA: hypothetical protein VLK32_08885 [Bacillota bacterium]|nr:hypothetical protein [Bacillota bacterium]